MTELNEEMVKKLSHLCRIEITDEELPAFYTRLKRILDYASQLQDIDVAHLSPFSHVEEGGVESLREDVVGTLLPRDVFLNNAPDHIGGMIKVPPVLRQNP
jgi:aspartyl-tRNA(Asn)/glutamyl-tRNA(Gln) amidotransferase subunit C